MLSGKRPTKRLSAGSGIAMDATLYCALPSRSEIIGLLADGKLLLARNRLVPLAFYPHGGKMAEEAQAMIARIDGGAPKAAAVAVAQE